MNQGAGDARTVASCRELGCTNIPLLTSKDRFRVKYEQAEQERKVLLAQNEKTLRDYNELERKFQQIKLENTVVSVELSEKTNQLKELSKVSQNVYLEYDKLKNQYELETKTLHRALSETKKRPKKDGDAIDGDEDLDSLKSSIAELSAENARLQTELSEAKLSEFEANEQLVNLSQEVEALQKRIDFLESQLRESKEKNDQLSRVSRLVSDELVEIRGTEKRHRQSLVTLREEADAARKERNILAHQSHLLLQSISLDSQGLELLQEIEQLKRSLEDNTNQYERQVTELQEKLEEMEHESEKRTEVTEERLKLAESDLQAARERIERLEEENELLKRPSAPPPPPLPPPVFTTINQPLAINRRPSETKTETKIDSTGLQEVVSQIKEKNFTLKKAKRPQPPRKESQPVLEMLTILGKLKKNSTSRSSWLKNK